FMCKNMVNLNTIASEIHFAFRGNDFSLLVGSPPTAESSVPSVSAGVYVYFFRLDYFLLLQFPQLFGHNLISLFDGVEFVSQLLRSSISSLEGVEATQHFIYSLNCCSANFR